MSIRRPSDLGYEDDGFILPELVIEPEFIAVGLRARRAALLRRARGHQGPERRPAPDAAAPRRCGRPRSSTAATGQWIVWHGLNDEGYALRDAIPGAVLVEGNQSPEEKAEAIEAFQDGAYRVLITKPRIAGFGMNLQNAHQMAFVGLSDSWEAYYQCIRRCWRFGQSEPVTAHVVLSDAEADIYENVMRKEEEAMEMEERLMAAVASTSGWRWARPASRGLRDRRGGRHRLADDAGRQRRAAARGARRDRRPLRVLPAVHVAVHLLAQRAGPRQQPRRRAVLGALRLHQDELLRVMKPGRNVAVHVSRSPRRSPTTA